VTNRRVKAIAGRLSLRSSQQLAPEATVKVERLDDFLGRARKLARLADAGKPIPESFVISFEDPADMRAVLTPAQRIKLTKVADGLGMLAKPKRKKLSDAKVKRRIGAMLKIRDEATKTR
jgi:hypothetical protein